MAHIDFPPRQVIGLRPEYRAGLINELDSYAGEFLNAWFVQSKTGAVQAIRANDRTVDFEVIVLATLGNIVWAASAFAAFPIGIFKISLAGIAIGTLGSIPPRKFDVQTKAESLLARAKDRFKRSAFLKKATEEILVKPKLIELSQREARRKALWKLMFNVPYGDSNLQVKSRTYLSELIKIADKLYKKSERNRRRRGLCLILKCFPATVDKRAFLRRLYNSIEFHNFARKCGINPTFLEIK